MTISIRSLLSGPLWPTTRITRPLLAKSVASASWTCSNFKSDAFPEGIRFSLQVVDVVDRQVVRGSEDQAALAFAARCDGAHFCSA